METALSESVTGVLRLADRRLRAVAADDAHEMCAVIRRSANAISPVETFYVGLYQGDNTLVMPYVFSGGVDQGPDTSRFGQGGLSHWIRSAARPYRYAQDGGRLCHAGVPLGDGTASQDIVVVPMFDTDGRTVIGMVNAQSLEPESFDDEFVTGLEWLARALALSLNIGSRSNRSQLYQDFPGLDSSRLNSPVDLLHAATERLEEVARLVDTLQSRAAVLDPAELKDGLAAVKAQCRRAGADLAVMAVRTPEPQHREHTDRLTVREQEIAELIANEALTNVAIAHRLSISEKTVKAHVSSILRKLGIHQRAELVWMLGSKSPNPTVIALDGYR